MNRTTLHGDLKKLSLQCTDVCWVHALEVRSFKGSHDDASRVHCDSSLSRLNLAILFIPMHIFTARHFSQFDSI